MWFTSTGKTRCHPGSGRADKGRALRSAPQDPIRHAHSKGFLARGFQPLGDHSQLVASKKTDARPMVSESHSSVIPAKGPFSSGSWAGVTRRYVRTFPVRRRFALEALKELCTASAIAALTLLSVATGQEKKADTGGEEMSLYKTYKHAARTPLPTPVAGEMPVEMAIKARRSVRTFADKPLTLSQISQILLSAYGITQRRGDEDHRAVPSAGAMYPLDIYLLAHHVDSLAPGLYHFQVFDSTLELVREGDFSEAIHEAANDQQTVGSSPATLIITATYGRITPRYGDRGHQYAHMEVGSVCQNVYLQAISLGLGTCAVGAFDDDAVVRLLEIGRRREVPMLVMPIGVPSGG